MLVVGQSAEGLLDFGSVCPGGRESSKGQHCDSITALLAQTSNNLPPSLSRPIMFTSRQRRITEPDYKKGQSLRRRHHPVQILLRYRSSPPLISHEILPHCSRCPSCCGTSKLRSRCCQHRHRPHD
ncbi:hypothetical protein JOB18_026108 [Solea senegalensis]|uniref:Uncharacterized protein n=1 Tax=Solea senegalensis TaxID=28829 RepID=A0AAV6R9Q7_SOLSE|nr:hypothetical protein JOB18_026108 [Solea senegalensis]